MNRRLETSSGFLDKLTYKIMNPPPQKNTDFVNKAQSSNPATSRVCVCVCLCVYVCLLVVGLGLGIWGLRI